jgi:pimeloyl-ACP methyl ester carboxylesterase
MLLGSLTRDPQGTANRIIRSDRMQASPLYSVGPYGVPVEWLSRSDGRHGEPVVLIHGFLASNAIWRVAALGEALRGNDAIALPLPGHYPWRLEPEATRRLLSVTERLVHAYCAALERLFGRRPVRLVGHSSGGMIALEIARRRPDLVADIFVFGAVGSGTADNCARLFRRILKAPVIGPAVCHTALWWWLSGPQNFRSGLRSACAKEADWPFDLDALRHDLRRSHRGALRAVGHWLAARDMFSYCDEIGVPTCVLLGTADPVSSPRHQLRLLRALPRAHAVLLRAGHLPIAEEPTAFARAVSVWLDRGPGGHSTSRIACLSKPFMAWA